METLERILAEHPFFQQLGPEYMQLLVSCASNVRFEADQYLFHEGDEANQFYFIRHGKVAIQIFVPGRGPITLQTVGEGEMLGWSWLIPPYQWRFDAQALELTRAIALDAKCLRAKCEEDHDLGYAFMKQFALVISERLQAARLQLLDVYGVRA